MPSLGNTTRPAYVYDAETDTWCPIGVGVHTHGEIPASIVDAKGDLIVGTAADTVQRRAVGADGSYLVADSTQTTGLNWAGPSNIAGKNFVINGAFEIWQRGTSFTHNGANGTGTYTADRWCVYGNAAGTNVATASRQSAGLTGFNYCIRYSRDLSTYNTNAQLYLGRSFETIDTIAWQGKTLTLSFYARAGSGFSSSGNVLQSYFTSGTGTDLNYITEPGVATSFNQANTLTTSWQRFTQTVTVGSTATASRFFFTYIPTGTSTTNDYFEITGVQLEVGSIATPFTRAGGHIQGELAICQRYYFRNTASVIGDTLINIGYANSSTIGSGQLQFPVPMRVAPTSLDSNLIRFQNYGGGAYNMTSIGFNENSNTSAQVYGTVSGVTAGHVGKVTAQGSSSYVGFSAEL